MLFGKHVLERASEVMKYCMLVYNCIHTKVIIVITALITANIAEWKSQNRSAVWLHIPISLSALIPLAAEQGFTLHHGKDQEVVMSYWLLEDKPNKLPPYASHQVGVCGKWLDSLLVCVCVCVCVCVLACVCACVCVLACACVRVRVCAFL